MTTLIQLKKNLAVTLAALMVLTTLPGGLLKASAAGSQTSLNIANGNIVIGSGSVTVGSSSVSYNANGYIITQTGSGTTSNTISVTGGTQNIVLQNVSVETSAGSAFSITSGASVNLTLSGTNTLKSGNGAGLEVPSGASLTIVGGDSLTATGSSESAGIGGCLGNIQKCGTIAINGGTVTAYGSYKSAAAIGGSNSPITINGGTVTAIGNGPDNNTYGNGIGGFSCSVTINGGTVTAHGGGGGAGIGGSWCTVTVNDGAVDAYGGSTGAGVGSAFDMNEYTVNINGGAVTAHGGSWNGAGIGSGLGSDSETGGTVNITGGSVKAYSGQQSAGIGGSLNISGGTVNISGGTVTATGNRTPGISGGNYYTDVAVNITGGSVNSTIQGTPTNGMDSVYMTTVSAPSGTAVSNLSLKQSGSKYTYGYKNMKTDGANCGKLYLWLPANTETTADVTTDGGSYNGYYGAVGTGSNSVLKMNQGVLTIGGIADGGKYTYGSVLSVTAGGGSGTGSITYTYTGTGSTDYSSTSEPSGAGAYSVTAKKAEDACYYASTATASFTIGPKGLTGSDVTVTIPVQEYTGSALTPDASVMYNGAALTKGTDYTVSYINNTDIAQSTDLNPPTATITFTGNYSGSVSKAFTIEAAPKISVGGNPTQWCTQATLTITPETGSSGLQSVKVDDGQNITDITSTYQSGYTVTQNGTYTFTVTDKANYSSSKSVTVDHIDTADPTISVSGNPESSVRSADLTVSSSAGISEIKSVKVSGPQGDGDITDTYRDGYTVNQNGVYTFTVTSGAGKTATKSITVSNIDITPALHVEARAGAGSYFSGTWTAEQSVNFTLSDTAQSPGTVTYQYRTDNGDTWADLTGTGYSVCSEGTTNLQFRIKSATGYFSNVISYTVNIDTTAPTDMKITHSTNPFKTILHFLSSNYFFGDTVTVHFSANDTGSGIDHYEYQKVDAGQTFNENGQWATGSSLDLSPDYKGTVYARAVDKLEHVCGYVSNALVVDKTAPTITANNGSTTFNTTDKNASIPVKVTDNSAGVGTVTYQVNNTTYPVDLTDESYNDVTNTYSFNIGSLPDGSYDVVVNAQDNSGNSARTVTVHVTQNTQPTVTNVSVTPGLVTLNHGDRQQFAVSVTGTNLTETASCVAWSVSGNRSSGTSIDANGNLTVASEEAATGLTVTAASTNNSTVNGQATVNINTSAQTGFGFPCDSISKTTTDAAFTISASGGQGDGAVTYTLTGGSGVVSLDGNKVTPLKVGTAIITATKAADGSFNQATATLAVYIGKGTPVITMLPTTSEINVVGKLSMCKLTGGSADVPGTFAWTNPDTIVTESGNYEATFTPTDTTDYNSRTCMVKVVVNPVIRDSGSDVAFDLTGVTLPNGVTSVSVGSSVQPKSDGNSAFSIVENQIGSGEKLDGLTVYNLKLLDQNSNPVENFTGKITVRIPIPSGMSGDLHVYWYNDTNGMVTDMNARQENGYLVFETTHFSYYAVAELSAKSSSGSGSIPNPDTGRGSFPYIPVALLDITGCGLAVVAKGRRFRKKN